MHGTCTPHKSHANPIKKVSQFYVIYIQYIFSISASLGGASRPPVHPPGTAAHGRVLARSASEAGAERQRSGGRRVHAWPSRSRSTLPLIRAACTAMSFARAQHPAVHQRGTPHMQRQKQPPAATHPPMLTPHRLPCHSTWNMAGCSPHSTPCAHALRAVPCSTTRESPRHSTPGTHALRAVPHSTTRPPNCPSLNRGDPP